MIRQRFGVALALLLGVGLLGGAVGTTFAAPSGGAKRASTADISAGEYAPSAAECEFLTIINQWRAGRGLGTLQLSATQGAASRHHSVEMADYNYFSHTLRNNVTWIQNLTNHGYNYQTIGTSIAENIAAGNESASATFNQWVNSSGHKANMENPNFKVIGIGRAYNQAATYDWYWTTTFGGKVLTGDTVSCSGGGTNPTPVPTPTQPAGGGAYTIARGARTSSSTSSTYAFDGNTSTDWHTTKSTPPSYGWVYFDLNSSKAIKSIKWLFNRGGSNDSYRIQVSNDRSNWTTIATLGGTPSGQWQSLTWSGNARYVRFYFTNPNNDAVLGYLAEVQIYP